MRTAGLSSRRIAARVGLSHAAVLSLAEGRTELVASAPAEAILAVAVETMGTAVGCQRRLRALVERGWPVAVLADRLGCTPQAVNLVLTGRTGADGSRRPSASGRTIAAVMSLYDLLWRF
ncbi:MAG: hypothetical protein LBL55_03655, partial [Propionibacteriaceae bacterium]|nr:hypothetical protein [Propionibacteriaceae bacterium]